jgi:hypothetical protein
MKVCSLSWSQTVVKTNCRKIQLSWNQIFRRNKLSWTEKSDSKSFIFINTLIFKKYEPI